MGFCVARESALEKTEGNSPSLVLDLYDQWRAMQKNRQWRFTPPTHVLLAFDQALNEYEEEGGVSGRGGRYRANCDVLVSGMREMGFNTLLPDAVAGTDHHHLSHAGQSRSLISMHFMMA